MQIPFTKLQDQYKDCKDQINTAIQKILDTDEFIAGPTVEKFEQTWSNHVQAQSCAAVGNGTFAVTLALLACGIKPGHEVITTAHTFVSTAEAIKVIGAKPVFVDIDEYYHIDATQIQQKITHNTKAILFVDLYGQTPNIDDLKQIAKTNNLFLIEDAAHSAGAEYKNQRVGNLVDLTCFSFNPIKNLGAIGDAGAVTGNKDLIDRVKMYRDHGRKTKYDYETIGFNARIDCIQAAVLLEKMQHYTDWNEQKRQKADVYNDQILAKTPLIRPHCLHSYYVYVIQVPARDDFILYMKEQGISTNIHYKKPLNTNQPYYPYQPCARTEWVCNQIVSLPCYYSLTESEQSYIIDHVNNWVKQYN